MNDNFAMFCNQYLCYLRVLFEHLQTLVISKYSFHLIPWPTNWLSKWFERKVSLSLVWLANQVSACFLWIIIPWNLMVNTFTKLFGLSEHFQSPLKVKLSWKTKFVSLHSWIWSYFNINWSYSILLNMRSRIS